MESTAATKPKTLAVVGIGRVGLPLAISFADAGLTVFGVDRDPEHVARVNEGVLPFIEHGAEEPLKRVVNSGKLVATTDGPAAIAQADAVVVTVGTPLGSDFRADRSQVEAALAAWGGSLKRDAVVIMRSTLSPGTTNNVVVPTLEKATGRKLGDGLFVAFCPERIAEGKAMEELKTLPEIIGGVDEASAERAAALFSMLAPNKEIRITDALSAELAKLYGNVYRYVTFALANEYALIAEHYGRDAHGIISMLRDGYSRAPVPLPGLAGGPCLSKDGYFLIEELTFPDFVLTAWKLNDSMAAHMVERLARRLELNGRELAGSRVAVLGQAFKADIDDDRLSPALRVIEALERRRADVVVHDPYLRDESLEEVLSGAEAVVLATNHSMYGDLEPAYVRDLVADGCVIAECWAMLDHEEFAAENIEIVTLGRG